LKPLSIRAAALAAIVVLGLLALAQAGAGLFSIDALDGSVRDLSTSIVPVVVEIGEIRSSTGAAQGLLGDELLANTAANTQELDAQLDTTVGAVETALGKYRALLVDPDEFAALDAVTADWNDWKSTAATIRKTVLAGFGSAAIAGYGAEQGKADVLGTAIAAMAADRLGDAQAASDAAAAAMRRAELTTGISVAVVVLAVIAVGMLLFRRVLRPLGRVTAAMRRIAGGELELDVPGLARRDELGEMARAVEIFRANGQKIRALGEAERADAELAAGRAAETAGMSERLAEAVGAAARGDFSQRIATGFGQDNLNSLAGIVNRLMETVERGLAETGAVLSAVAAADLTRRVAGDYDGAFLRLKNDTNAVADKFADIVSQLQHTSRSLKLVTGEILSGANDLSERTSKQASTIEETSAAMEQLAGTVQQNAGRAHEASQVAAAVTHTAEEGGQVMAAANEAMERITASSAKISSIIGVIDDISFQTNLLALNASVEAARAGEAGKGFAVVAVEVRRLAQSAAEASKEIKVLIDQSGAEVSGGSRLVADAAGKLAAMLAAARSSNELMGGIARDSREQASAIEEVSTAVRQLDQMTQHNAALVEEINAAIEQTETQAVELDRVVDVFAVADSGDRAKKPAAAPAAVPLAPKARGGVKAMQDKVRHAARTYLARGNTAAEADWSEF
jgi:methyl-accepting chemotaxis protein